MPLTKKEIAKMISDSVSAALAIAVASGSPLDVDGVASAAGNNAAFVIAFEAHERGIEEP